MCGVKCAKGYTRTVIQDPVSDIRKVAHTAEPWKASIVSSRFISLVGVESATGLLRPLSSRPPDLLMRGWLSMDRVIDAPVYRDILTWERLTGPVLSAFQALQGPFQSSSLHLL